MAYTNIRLIPFIYSSSVAYLIELGNLYGRVFYADTEVCTFSTSYLTEDLFELDVKKQIGDVIWICHPQYPPTKITRTDSTTFVATEIPFKKGPFLLRHDLAESPDYSTMTYSGDTAVGSSGVLNCNDMFFIDPSSGISLPSGASHIGTLIKLTYPRPVMVTEGTYSSGSLPYVICAAIDVKGTFRINTHGNWGGTVIVERNENDSGWDVFRTYISSIKNDAGDRNIQESPVGGEENDNVQYRASVTKWDSGELKMDITVDTPTVDSIVKITAVNTEYEAQVEVITLIQSTNSTTRWSEGCWSAVGGYPSSVTFFEDRCIYLGQTESERTVIGWT